MLEGAGANGAARSFATSDAERPLETGESLQVVGPQTGFEPAAVVGISRVERMLIEAQALHDRRHGAFGCGPSMLDGDRHGTRWISNGPPRRIGDGVVVEEEVESRRATAIKERYGIISAEPNFADRRLEDSASLDFIGLREALLEEGDDPGAVVRDEVVEECADL